MRPTCADHSRNADRVQASDDRFERVAGEDGDDDGNEELAGRAEEHRTGEAGQNPKRANSAARHLVTL